MAIDTAAKRRSALLEGMVIPDGTVSGSDKAWAVWMYSGIDYEAAAVNPPDSSSLEWANITDEIHYRIKDKPLHWRTEGKLEYRAK